MSGKFLEKNSDASLQMLKELEKTARFDEVDQIRNIFEENILTAKSGIISSGNSFAMMRASHGHTLAANISEELAGISRLGYMKNFLKKSDPEITEIFENFYKKMTENAPLTITVSRENFVENIHSETPKFEKIISEEFTPFKANEAWLTDLAVGYCAASIPTIASHHEDAPLLVLLGQFLRDGYLHSAIRERGGAYGSGANYDATSQSFRFFSYRDPRIEGTFADFEASIKWLLETEHDEERLDEAKMGVIAKIDTPKSPAEDAFAAAFMEIKGLTREQQNAEREKILSATIDDIKRVTKAYLSDFSKASRVVITGKQNREICEKM